MNWMMDLSRASQEKKDNARQELQNSASEKPVLGQGSVYLGANTSYSGADIKVVVNLYGNPQVAIQTVQSLTKELSDLQAQYNKSSEVTQSTERLASMPKDSQEQQIYATSIAKNSSEIDAANLPQSIANVQKRLADAQKDKDTGGARTLVLAECQSLSISSYRDKRDVRSLGSVYPKGITRGPRTIAGTLVFTVFDQSVLWEIMGAHPSDFDGAQMFTSAIMDQLPPVDIIISFANEYGNISRMALYGVEFVSEGTIMSISDILTENTVSYMARDFDPMRVVGSKVKSDNGSASLATEFTGKRASDLIGEDDFKDFQGSSAYQRFLDRRNPFL